MVSLYGEGLKKVITWKKPKDYKVKNGHVFLVEDEAELLEEFVKT